MNKKGQITVFIILGLVILLTIVYLTYFVNFSTRVDTSTSVEQGIRSAANVQQTKTYIEHCLRDASIKNIKRFGYQGGYFDLPNPLWYENRGGVRVAYGLKDSFKLIPDIMSAQNILEQETIKDFQDCMNLTPLSNLNINIIEQGNPGITYSMNKKDIFVRLDYPIKISNIQNKSGTALSEFSVTLPVGLSEILLIASDLVEQIDGSAGLFDLRTLDYSCAYIRACYEENSFVRLISYRPYSTEPFYLFQFTVEGDIFPNTCTSLDNLNSGVC